MIDLFYLAWPLRPRQNRVSFGPNTIIANYTQIETTRLALGLCPLAGVMLFLSAFGKSRTAATVAMASGASVLGYTFCKLAYAFITITGAGLWLVLAAGVVALVAGLSARASASRR